MRLVEIAKLENVVINKNSLKNAPCVIEIEEDDNIKQIESNYKNEDLSPVFIKCWDYTENLSSKDLELCAVYDKSNGGMAYILTEQMTLSDMVTCGKEEGPHYVHIVINNSFRLYYCSEDCTLSIPHPSESRWSYWNEEFFGDCNYEEQYIAHHNYDVNKIIKDLSLFKMKELSSMKYIENGKGERQKISLDKYLMIFSRKEYDNIDFTKMSHIEHLCIKKCDIDEINQAVLHLKNLKTLDISGNGISDLTGLRPTKSLEKLDVSANRLTEIPKEIFNLINLKSLNIKHNRITTLSNEITKLTRLEYLNIGNNNLAETPEFLAELASLKNLESKDDPWSFDWDPSSVTFH